MSKPAKISDCIKKCNLFPVEEGMKKREGRVYASEDDYQKSFNDIKNFSKSITPKEKKDVDTIIFHDENEDGVISAYIYWKYLEEQGKGDNVNFIGGKPYSGQGYNKRLNRNKNKILGKNVVILDIAFGKETLDFIAHDAKSVLIIDDHDRNVGNNSLKRFGKRAFIGTGHATCAYVWKFLYPTKNVPLYVQYVDDNDRKLMMNHLAYANLIRTYQNYKIIHNPYLGRKNTVDAFKKIDVMLGDVDKDYMLLAGSFYDEIANNIKDQIAINARPTDFLGFKVTTLNFGDPALSKMIGRQMMTNAEKSGWKVDFAILWSWEYTSNSYRIMLSEKHEGKPNYDLPSMARSIAKVNGSKKGGGGAMFTGNCYFERINGQDIWDLFDNKNAQKYLKYYKKN
jgi:hypothetical protein